mmetsp:Transcript_30039/g.71250  ORF Transcript_30039/g.71250 Transcript_30039/m.71250 type:complete len:179 (+) Transcript_30039:316-852(+)|eukprot:CAMPEP_0177701256 /NCGR_PEP_ID=MMETSP0484_2-20121128/6519_1 /TAXON_ID=354590 /ORGANISM="Rhodomonas lens, Strain RHODO" /LENGTH=178 /DNA_ID=CAMNT_0019212487 /DNA_START=316 /DNA_END=852 /DNA_ORIENTATION=+
MDFFGFLCSPTSNSVAASGKDAPEAGAKQERESVASWIGCCDPKRPVAIASNVMSTGRSLDERAGVGIILALHPDGSLYVHTVCTASSAEGHLLPGDVLMKIGEEDVFRAPAPHVAELLLGMPGTTVDVAIRRSTHGDGSPPFTSHVVSMQRRRTDPELARTALRKAFEDHNKRDQSG